MQQHKNSNKFDYTMLATVVANILVKWIRQDLGAEYVIWFSIFTCVIFDDNHFIHLRAL